MSRNEELQYRYLNKAPLLQKLHNPNRLQQLLLTLWYKVVTIYSYILLTDYVCF
jgi:hypothetical protein